MFKNSPIFKSSFSCQFKIRGLRKISFRGLFYLILQDWLQEEILHLSFLLKCESLTLISPLFCGVRSVYLTCSKSGGIFFWALERPVSGSVEKKELLRWRWRMRRPQASSSEYSAVYVLYTGSWKETTLRRGTTINLDTYYIGIYKILSCNL